MGYIYIGTNIFIEKTIKTKILFKNFNAIQKQHFFRFQRNLMSKRQVQSLAFVILTIVENSVMT